MTIVVTGHSTSLEGSSPVPMTVRNGRWAWAAIAPFDWFSDGSANLDGGQASLRPA
jgi:hypothetical protein